MRIEKLYILIVLIVFGCNQNTQENLNIEPAYADYKSDWEERNLFNKVKSLREYKANLKNNGETDDINPFMTTEFTSFGSVNKLEYYDSFGKSIQTDEFLYDDNENLIKSVSVNIPSDQIIIQKIVNDTVQNIVKQYVTLNDSLYFNYLTFSDEEDYIIKRMEIKSNDTTVVHHDYQFNELNKLISETQFGENADIPVVENTFRYDKNGNLIESSQKTKWSEIITETEWKNGRILMKTKYIISPDIEKHIENIIKYDSLYNPITVKTYDESKLNRESKNIYEFDKKGNWIKKTVYIREHFRESDKFIPIHVETREIEYWN